MRKVAILALLLFASIAPAQPPKDMLASRVQADGCQCDKTGVCLCVPHCACPDTKAAWSAMLARGLKDNQAVVVFAGGSNRQIEGVLTIGFSQWCSDVQCYKNAVIVVRPMKGAKSYPISVLPAKATDAQIIAAGKMLASPDIQSLYAPPAAPPVVRQAAYSSPPGTHRHEDSQGHVWQHGNQNVGHVAPHVSPWTGEVVFPRYYGPKAPERVGGLSAAPNQNPSGMTQTSTNVNQNAARLVQYAPFVNHAALCPV